MYFLYKGCLHTRPCCLCKSSASIPRMQSTMAWLSTGHPTDCAKSRWISAAVSSGIQALRLTETPLWKYGKRRRRYRHFPHSLEEMFKFTYNFNGRHKPRMDRIRNEYVGWTEQLERFNEKETEERLRWVGHVQGG